VVQAAETGGASGRRLILGWRALNWESDNALRLVCAASLNAI